MSDGDWPAAGPGVSRPYDAALDGVTSKRKAREPGSVRGPGSSPSRGKSRNALLYDAWLDVIEPATFGIPTSTAVKRQLWNANLKQIRDKVPTVTDPTLRGAFKAFAEDSKARRVDVTGKNAWFCFMARWPRYVKHSDADINAASPEEQIENTW